MNYTTLPRDLPIPQDDGAATHLLGLKLPAIALQATDGNLVNLDKLSGLNVIYIYPMTGQPDVALPDGWDEIPGARGCTPQSCSFRDHAVELYALNARIFGLSAQPPADQVEAKTRLHLPFELLSDALFELADLIRLPTFKVGNLNFYKRITLVLQDNVIVKVFYPVFPPDKHVGDVMDWLKNN